MDSSVVFIFVVTGVKSAVLSGCCPNSLAFCAGVSLRLIVLVVFTSCTPVYSLN